MFVAGAACLLLLANTLRVATLFMVETGPALPGAAHSGVGLVLFAGVLAALLGGARWLSMVATP